MKLPVIIERNSWTLPQERYNADWVREKEVGIVRLKSFQESVRLSSEMLDAGGSGALPRERRSDPQSGSIRNSGDSGQHLDNYPLRLGQHLLYYVARHIRQPEIAAHVPNVSLV